MTGARSGAAEASGEPTAAQLVALREATLSSTYVSMGSRRTTSVHEFYRYPARFSPAFARAAIEAFSGPGDFVIDPFVGGGTTVVEARLAGRLVLGSDLNPLAAFVTRTKATVHYDGSLDRLRTWGDALPDWLNIHGTATVEDHWINDGYFRGLDRADTWRLRKLIAQALEGLRSVPSGATRDLARLAVLRTSQWALDMRTELPTVEEFRTQLPRDVAAMADTADVFSTQVKQIETASRTARMRSSVLNVGLPGLAGRWILSQYPKPALVLTSPPYPGVYVLYHRWKLQGRKEIPAPYWIVDCPDGNGHAFYTMHSRAQRTLDRYFGQLQAAFADIATMIGPTTYVVQMVGFNDVETHLPAYLAAMENAGLEEIQFQDLANSDDGRLWRSVPSRRWWVVSNTRKLTAPQTAQEAVLVHRLRQRGRMRRTHNQI
jgi:hypothetical protein